MVDYKKATFEDILADAKENDRTDYLKTLGAKKFKDKMVNQDIYLTYRLRGSILSSITRRCFQ